VAVRFVRAGAPKQHSDIDVAILLRDELPATSLMMSILSICARLTRPSRKKSAEKG
jgi:hypothetical protein